jgi:DNA-binding transcriptional LysR family regulator
MEWDDLRYVLAVHREGSVAAASRVLGVSNVTVFRRIDAIEDALGVRLFDRTKQGYVATAAAAEIVEQAAPIEQQIRELESRVSKHDSQVRGTVRVTTVDTWGALLLPPMIQKLGGLHPGLRIHLIVDSELLNITQREADIAIRSTAAPPENLIGHRLGAIRYSAYAAKPLARRLRGKKDLSGVPWIGVDPPPTGHLADIRRWIRINGYEGQLVLTSNSVLEAAMAIRSGVGVGVISDLLAGALGGVVAVSEQIAELRRDIWILVHPDLRDVARVTAVYTFLRTEFGKLLSDRSARA